ncbi:PaaI family thioesterase [Paracoccus sp. Z118]|uniref:PaaI family thioesterase n=1 Tax=Paracoccus sp. Z118 TaxID=2851017 RepID=UPI001C2B8AC1|nr:PaaI family thioesterase [Paracoccus sp. Z118]MBV0892899.1 PaaI family thioesterase [Paracoccus sp. Z118]
MADFGVGDLNDYLAEVFPQAKGYVVEEIGAESVRVRLQVEDRHLRPGGTISGPTMFELADFSMYAAILSRIGKVALAVTTNAGIDFMRKPEAARDLLAEARLLKLGRVLAVGDVMIRSDGGADVVARASMTYSIPPERAENGGLR